MIFMFHLVWLYFKIKAELDIQLLIGKLEILIDGFIGYVYTP